jgi:C1A family cysteine protease
MGKIARYGWLPDLPDKRDLRFTTERLIDGPPLIDLTWGCPPVYDQGQLGSCTANAIAGTISWERHHQGLGYLIPSRLFIYWNERALEGATSSDSGASLRDGMITISAQGICSDYRWPYDESMVLVQPPAECYAAAVSHKTLKYLAVGPTLPEIKNCLANSYPFVFGFSVYDSFESNAVTNTGIVPMPRENESLLGGHAVMAVGKNDGPPIPWGGQTWPTGYVLVRNSWGASWGAQGYCFFPYEYIADQDLVSDLWTVRLEE